MAQRRERSDTDAALQRCRYGATRSACEGRSPSASMFTPRVDSGGGVREHHQCDVQPGDHDAQMAATYAGREGLSAGRSPEPWETCGGSAGHATERSDAELITACAGATPPPMRSSTAVTSGHVGRPPPQRSTPGRRLSSPGPVGAARAQPRDTSGPRYSVRTSTTGPVKQRLDVRTRCPKLAGPAAAPPLDDDVERQMVATVPPPERWQLVLWHTRSKAQPAEARRWGSPPTPCKPPTGGGGALQPT
jgi:hypothetical protein